MLQDYEYSDPDSVRFYVPILLTNAEIFHLRENITVENVRNANSLDDIARAVDALAVYRDIDDDMARYCDKVAGSTENIALPPQLRAEINEKAYSFRRATSQVFVVRLKALRAWIRELQQAVNDVSITVVEKK